MDNISNPLFFSKSRLIGVVGAAAVAAIVVLLFNYMQKPAVSSSSVFVEDLVYGKTTEVDVRVFNSSFLPVRVVGVSCQCPCVSFVSKPVSIPARSSATLPFTMTPQEIGAFQQRALLYLDNNQLSTVFFYGTVKERG